VEAAGREPAGEQRGGNEHERRAAIKEISGQALLAEIAKNDSNENVRRAAVEKLTDQAQLAEVAKNAGDSYVRRAAAGKLADHAFAQPEYADVAKTAGEKGTPKVTRGYASGDTRVYGTRSVGLSQTGVLLIALLLISGLVPAANIGSLFAKGFAESVKTSGPLVHVAAAWPQFSGNSLTPLELFASWKIW
jgi:hypothetical protein